jgi:hypothetical protein
MDDLFKVAVRIYGLILDVALAVVVAYLFPDNKASGCGITLVVLVILPYVLFLWGMVKVKILFLFPWPIKAEMVRKYVDFLKSDNLPCVDTAENLTQYFAQATADASLPIETRLKAANNSGWLTGFMVDGPLPAKKATYFAAEVALRRYQAQRRSEHS